MSQINIITSFNLLYNFYVSLVVHETHSERLTHRKHLTHRKRLYLVVQAPDSP